MPACERLGTLARGAWRALPLAGVFCLCLLLHAGIAASAEGETEA